MWEHKYLALLDQVFELGEHNKTRNGMTRSVFGAMLEIRDLEDDRFPLLTTRKMFPRGIFGELAAFVRGTEMLQGFKNFGCNYWDDNAKAWHQNRDKAVSHMRVGRIYGAQWRNFGGRDQLSDLIGGLKLNPESRRHVMTTFNPAEVDQGCLPPCHLLVQYSVRRKGWLESCIYMRSVDLCVGLPTDVALYAALQIALAAELNLQPGAMTFMLGDAHIYENHFEQMEIQLKRPPFDPPEYSVADGLHVKSFYPEDIQLLDYKHHDAIPYAFNV